MLFEIDGRRRCCVTGGCGPLAFAAPSPFIPFTLICPSPIKLFATIGNTFRLAVELPRISRRTGICVEVLFRDPFDFAVDGCWLGDDDGDDEEASAGRTTSVAENDVVGCMRWRRRKKRFGSRVPLGGGATAKAASCDGAAAATALTGCSFSACGSPSSEGDDCAATLPLLVEDAFATVPGGCVCCLADPGFRLFLLR